MGKYWRAEAIARWLNSRPNKWFNRTRNYDAS